jgi:hypothetical protein
VIGKQLDGSDDWITVAGVEVVVGADVVGVAEVSHSLAVSVLDRFLFCKTLHSALL